MAFSLQYEQLPLPKFPAVSHPDRLSVIRQWTGYRWRANILCERNDGTPAPDVLAAMMRAHPHVQRANFVSLSPDDAIGIYNQRRVFGVDTRQHFDASAVHDMNASLSQKFGWGSESRALGVLSRCMLDNGTIVHMPIMRFGRYTDQNEIHASMSMFGGGYVLDDGPRGSYYWGGSVLPYEKWIRFMEYCDKKVPGSDSTYIQNALRMGSGVLRLFGIRGNNRTPQVVHVIS